MKGGPQSSAGLRPVRSGQRIENAGAFGRLIVIPQLNLVVTGVESRPIAQGVSLEVPPERSDCMTVWLGYDAAEQGNRLPITFQPFPDWPTPVLNQATRRLFAVIAWGSGGGKQFVEVDVAEGCGVTVPTATCEVYVYSETTRTTPVGDEIDPLIEEQPWSVYVHAAPGRAATGARRTRQVVSPQGVPAELLPPNPAPSRPREEAFARAVISDASVMSNWLAIARHLISGGAHAHAKA